MTGIGQIIAGRKKQVKAKEESGSRAAWITGQLETQKLGSTMADFYTSAALLGSMGSQFSKANKPYEEMQAGAKEVGIDMPDQTFGQKVGRMFGRGDDILTKTFESEGEDSYQYREDDPLSVKKTHEYSGSTLMDIGKRAKTGTLQSYLEGESIGDKFGKDVSEQKWWDAKMGQMDAHEEAPQRRGIGGRGQQGAYANRNLLGGTSKDFYNQGKEPGQLDSSLGRKGMTLGPDKFELQVDPYSPEVYNRFYAPEAGSGPGQSENYRAGTHAADPNYDQLQGGTQGMGGSGQFDDPESMTDFSAKATADRTDYASYDTGYRTSNAHASGYEGMGYDPNEGGLKAMPGSGAPGSDTIDASAAAQSPTGQVRFEHTPSPGYAGEAERTGQYYSDQEPLTDRERAKRDPMAGYEPGYKTVPDMTPLPTDATGDYEKYMTDMTSDDPYRGKPSWLNSNYSMYQTYRDSTK